MIVLQALSDTDDLQGGPLFFLFFPTAAGEDVAKPVAHLLTESLDGHC